MKIIGIGDIHGHDTWKRIVNDNPDADKFVFAGDYVDSYSVPHETQINNLLDILQFKKDNPDKVVLLIGNHDFQYTQYALGIYERYTGFNELAAGMLAAIFKLEKDLFQAAYLHDNILFTHAGVTSTWIKSTVLLMEEDHFDLGEVPVDEYINQVYKASPYFFTLPDGGDPYGNNIFQSPIWVRPMSFKRNAYKYDKLKQVVGHTGYNKIQIVKNRFAFIDTLPRQYLKIEYGEFIPVTLTL